MNRIKIRNHAKQHGHSIAGDLRRVKLPKISGHTPPAMFADSAGTAYFPRKNDVVIVPLFVGVGV